MENPFNSLDQRLSKIESLIHNLDENFTKLKFAEKKSQRVSEYLDTHQVAELTHVKLTTIYAYNSRGSIPIYSYETPIIYKREEIMEWLENGKKLTPRLKKLMEDRKIIKV